MKTRLEEMVKDEFGSILLQYSRQSQSFLNKIVRQMEDILGIRIEGIIVAFDLDVYTSFYIYKSDLKYTIPFIKKKSVYNIMPDPLVRRMVLKQIYSNCMTVVNPNAGRIRSDIDYKISESFRKFSSQFNRKLYELLQSLKNMIDESIQSKQTMHEDMKEILRIIREQKQQIVKIHGYYQGAVKENVNTSVGSNRGNLNEEGGLT
jgi:hypothetical protein